VWAAKGIDDRCLKDVSGTNFCIRCRGPKDCQSNSSSRLAIFIFYSHCYFFQSLYIYPNSGLCFTVFIYKKCRRCVRVFMLFWVENIFAFLRVVKRCHYYTLDGNIVLWAQSRAHTDAFSLTYSPSPAAPQSPHHAAPSIRFRFLPAAPASWQSTTTTSCLPQADPKLCRCGGGRLKMRRAGGWASRMATRPRPAGGGRRVPAEADEPETEEKRRCRIIGSYCERIVLP
jgi:hypothetical protein